MHEGFFVSLPYVIIPILVGQWALFWGFRQSPSLFIAATMFTVINTGFRVINSYVVGEPLNVYGWCAVVCLVASAVLFRMK